MTSSSSSSIFQKPPEWRPGFDLASKNLLKHQDVKDIVTRAVVSTAGEMYSLGDTNWPYGSTSDVVNASQHQLLDHPPIIIEVQYEVTFDFINRDIRYCTMAYNRYSKLPVLIVYCINKVTGIASNLIQPSILPCSTSLVCDLWARKCIIISKDLVQSWIGKPLVPFAALTIFMVSKEECLVASANWQDATLEHLFGVMKQMIKSKMDREALLLDAIASIC
ncbi:hypothetical protein DM01DRAFT_1274071, partial [Hesseltinella vesiculosa]